MPEQHTPYDSGYRLAPVPHEYVIYNDTDTRRICITEIYDGTDWSDPDRVASAWDVRTEQRVPGDPEGWKPVSEHTYSAENVHRVIDETTAWTRSVNVERAAAQQHSPGVSAGKIPPPPFPSSPAH